MRATAATGGREAVGEGACDRGGVVVERAAGEEDRRDDDCSDPAIGQGIEYGFEGEAGQCRDRDESDDGNDAGAARVRSPVQRPVEEADEGSDQADRMGHAAPEKIRIADQRIDRQRCGEQPEMRGRNQCAAPTRRASAASQSRAAGSDGPPQTVSFSGSTMRFAGG